MSARWMSRGMVRDLDLPQSEQRRWHKTQRVDAQRNVWAEMSQAFLEQPAEPQSEPTLVAASATGRLELGDGSLRRRVVGTYSDGRRAVLAEWW